MRIRPHDKFPPSREDSRVEAEDLITVRVIDYPDRGIWTKGAVLFRQFVHDAAGPIDAPAVQDEDFALGQDPVIDETLQRSKDPLLFIEAGHDYCYERRSILCQIFPLIL